MPDTSGQANIRGIQIDKISRDYENEALILKNLVSVEATSAREIRWYQKTSGFLTFSSLGSIKVGAGARPFILEQSWTRNTSYVKKYFVESPTISIEDEQDNDVQIVLENLRDLTSSVAYAVDSDIWDVLSENRSPVNINSVTSTAAWDAASGQDPYKDILDAKYKIRLNTKRKIQDGYLLVSPKGEKDLLAWIRTAGATIPLIAGQKLESGDLLNIAGLKVITSAVVTADYAMVADLSMACVFKQFIPLTSRIIIEEGIGKKIRVWEEGIALLVRPKYVSLISNTEA
jgi:hypothetical protein